MPSINDDSSRTRSRGLDNDAPHAMHGTSPAKTRSPESTAKRRGDDERYGEDTDDGELLQSDEATGHDVRKVAPPAPTDGQQGESKAIAPSVEHRDEPQDERRPSDDACARPSDPGMEAFGDPASSEEKNTASAHASRAHDGTRDLLPQAHHAVREEVAALRAEVKHYKLRTGAALRRQRELQTRGGAAERQLARVTAALKTHGAHRARWTHEKAELERDLMNQMNATCAAVAATETKLMGEIVKRDVKIVELTTLWTEEARQRTVLAREREILEREREIGKFI